MRAMTSGLIALLESGEYEFADCWTITLNGGSILRYTSADIDVRANTLTFLAGPQIARGAISEKRGVEVSTLKITITADDSNLVAGKPLIQFIKGRGLDGATIKLERAFGPDWTTLSTFPGTGATGTLIRFAGKITSIDKIQGLTVELTATSWMVLLNVQMPRNLYQARCLHTLYDAGCTLNPASFRDSGTITGIPTTQQFNTAVPGHPDGYYNLGRIVFTTGPNAGVSRTIRSSTFASGTIVLTQPLPALPIYGDAFSIYAGCDLTQATCTSKFSNLPNFKATPFVPLPQTPLSTPSTTTTTTSGGKGGE